MPYTVAVALTYGEIDEKHFGERYLRDPKLLALTKKVKAEATAEADARMPDAMLCRMTLVTVLGESHETAVEYHRGHWKNPMSKDEVEGKFRKLAANVLNEREASELLDTLWGLEDVADASAILRLTVANRGASSQHSLAPSRGRGEQL
jgi:2-methylcitrate dehydratase